MGISSVMSFISVINVVCSFTTCYETTELSKLSVYNYCKFIKLNGHIATLCLDKFLDKQPNLCLFQVYFKGYRLSLCLGIPGSTLPGVT